MAGPVGAVAITLGDPRGIGPEVAERAARRFLDERPDIPLQLIGPEVGIRELSLPRRGSLGRLRGRRGAGRSGGDRAGSRTRSVR